MKTQEMLSSHPRKPIYDVDRLAACIAACIECADSCNSCADACLGEQMVQSLIKCIRLNLDCADICQTTARILSRQTAADPEMLQVQLDACATACRLCAHECDSHAEMHRHCRFCASSCRSCEQMCRELLTIIPGGSGARI